LSVVGKVLRDGRWNEQDASVLVPGDIISIKLGDIIPADARLLEGDPLKIDQVCGLFLPSSFSFKIISLLLYLSYIPNGSVTPLFPLCCAFLQSALTGESLPVSKGPGDGVYSGSTCKQGEIEAVVIATGVHTFFGKAAHLVDTTNQVGHFQKVTRRHHIFSILNVCFCAKRFHLFYFLCLKRIHLFFFFYRWLFRS